MSLRKLDTSGVDAALEDFEKQRKARLGEVKTRRGRIGSSVQAIEFAARALIEEDSDLAEEQEQLEGHTSAPSPSDDEPTSSDSTPPAEPPAPQSPTPATPPADPPAPAEEPTPTAPQPPVAPMVPAAPSSFDPRDWHIMCWLFAVIGLVIGFVIGLHTRNIVSDEVDNLQWLVSGIWILALTGVGFYLFGLLCAIVRDFVRARTGNTP